MKSTAFLMMLTFFAFSAKSQYVQPERNDTTYIYPKLKFDSAAVIKEYVGKGTCTIRGVAYKGGLVKSYAYKTTVLLFPVTPYLLDFLDLKAKKENVKRKRIVYMSDEAYKYHNEAITNTTGDFTFSGLRPGKYYLETVVIVSSGYAGKKLVGTSGDDYSGHINYYKDTYTNFNNYFKVSKFVDIDKDDQIVDVKLH